VSALNRDRILHASYGAITVMLHRQECILDPWLDEEKVRSSSEPITGA